jgi:SNF2 family DNA or RNA helicase
MTVAIQGDSIVISCAGAEFIRVRAALHRALGSKCRDGRDRFFVPVECADFVASQFPAVAASESLRRCRAELELHHRAVTEANEELRELCIKRVPDDWIEILDVPQQYAVNALVHPGLRGACLFDEQGTGKTIMALAAFDILVREQVVEQTIVVSPKSMLGVWQKDIVRFTGERYSVGIVEGDTRKKRATVDEAHDILIVNYEGVENVLVLLEAVAKQKRTLLIVDESYYAKNPAALRTKLLLQLRPACARCFVLCGTPAPRSPYDIISQVDLADNHFAFATFSKSDSEDEDRERVSEILRTRAVAIRRLKQDVLADVPEKNFEIVRVQLQGRQRYLYEKARDEMIVELRKLDNTSFKKRLTSYFQMRTALLEICAVPKMVDPQFAERSAKLAALVGLVERLVGEGRKVLIWTCYRLSVTEIVAALSRYSPLVIDGSETRSQVRSAVVEKFQTDPNSFVLVANPAAAGAGITLHASHDAIYYSYTNQAAQYLQSLDRIHRRGQTSKVVNYYMMICEGTIEEKEVRRLRQRELAQHDLLGDVVEWPESLDNALAELGGGGRLL